MVKTFVTSKKSYGNAYSYFGSQYTAGAAMMLTSITHGTFNGWATACLPTLKSDQSPIQLNDDQVSWVVSIQFFGNMVSAIPAGLLMDKYGCKKTLMCSLILPLTAWALLYLSNHLQYWQIMILSRFLSGFWIGINNTIVPLYISEISKPNIRGFLSTMFNVTFRVGNIYALITALFVSYSSLPIIYSIFIIIFILIVPLIPESPHYYIKNDDMVSAKKSLVWLRDSANDTDTELRELEISVKKQMENTGTFSDLLATKGSRKALFIVETLTILQKLSGISSIISYLSIILPKSMMFSPPILVVIIELLRLGSSLTSSLIYDTVGSRVLLILTSSICGSTMFITGLWYFLDSHSTAWKITDYSWIPFLCITLHGISYSLGLNPVCTNIKSEFFPINIKGKCSAITCTIVGLTSFIVNKTFLHIGNTYGIYVNFWIYSVSSITMALFANQFLIETKGKSLQQIQDELNRKKKPKVDINL